MAINMGGLQLGGSLTTRRKLKCLTQYANRGKVIQSAVGLWVHWCWSTCALVVNLAFTAMADNVIGTLELPSGLWCK